MLLRAWYYRRAILQTLEEGVYVYFKCNKLKFRPRAKRLWGLLGAGVLAKSIFNGASWIMGICMEWRAAGCRLQAEQRSELRIYSRIFFKSLFWHGLFLLQDVVNVWRVVRSRQAEFMIIKFCCEAFYVELNRPCKTIRRRREWVERKKRSSGG